ncbi:MAG: hypothetical protein ABSF62_11020, partial [Bryobacteraceae bacterium]
MAAFQEQFDVARRAGVSRVCGQAFHARAQAAVDVVLQARLRMEARQVHLAGRHFEMAVDEMHQAVGQ